MDVTITGAAGFIGRNLTSWLAAGHQHYVRGFDRDEGWPALASGLDQAEFVFHLAGVNRPEHDEEYVAGNADLTEQITKDGTSFGTLNPLDPDVLDREGFECQYRGGEYAGNQDGQQGFLHYSAVEQAGNIVKKGKSHQGNQYGHANLLGNLH